VKAQINKKIIVGAIGDAFGVKGWSHLISFTDPKENIFNYQNWQIQVDKKNKDHFKPVKYDSFQPHGNGFVVKIENTHDRDQALLLKGKTIAVDRADLPTLKKNEYYWSDLIGLNVINTAGKSLGIVDHLFETGSNDVIVTKNNIYIPYLKSVVKEIDLGKKIIIVEWE